MTAPVPTPSSEPLLLINYCLPGAMVALAAGCEDGRLIIAVDRSKPLAMEHVQALLREAGSALPVCA